MTPPKMKENNIRIAIISPLPDESAKVGMSLSKIVGIPYISGELSGVEYQEIYDIGKKGKCTSNEICTAILARFHLRIRSERLPSFVSNGTVLCDIIMKGQEIRQKKMVKQSFFYRMLATQFHEFEGKVVKLIEDYAQTAYDRVYFLRSSDLIQDKSSTHFENSMLEILNRRGIGYTVISGDSESSLHAILSDLKRFTIDLTPKI